MSQTKSQIEYLTQIHQLKQLQQVDDKIYDASRVLERGPKELEELQAQFDRIDARRKHILEKIEHLTEQTNRVNREIEEEASRLKKSKNKLMSTGNEREFQAVTREIDNIEKLSQPHEDERIALSEELRNQNEELDSISEEHTMTLVRLNSRKESFDREVLEANDRLAVLDKQRQKCAAEIGPIIHRYEFIRTRLKHPVIVSLSDCICPSCHIAVPPQTFNDLLRGESIQNCPNCQRLIVWRDHYLADDPEALAAARADDIEEPKPAAPMHFAEDDIINSGE